MLSLTINLNQKGQFLYLIITPKTFYLTILKNFGVQEENTGMHEEALSRLPLSGSNIVMGLIQIIDPLLQLISDS